MNYQDFLTYVSDRFRQEFPDDAKIVIEQVTKNNGTVYDGLIIFRKDRNISPTIYLNPYYARYQNGVSLDRICRELVQLYRINEPSQNADISWFTDFEKAKGQIAFKLINYERNRGLLAEVPYSHFLDLAIVYYCFLPQIEDTCATVLICNHHLRHWGTTPGAIHALAMQNTPRLLSWQLLDFNNIVRTLLEQTNGPSGICADDPMMYILTNSDRQNGASVLCYENLLTQLTRELRSDLLILPSSIHEVLLIPSDGLPEDTAGINNVIQEINRQQLAAEEVLSDHAYFFSAKGGLQGLV